MTKSNIVLIGMPGSGKSTIGALFAKKTSRNFIDTDLLIQTKEGRSLQSIVDNDGYLILRSIEEKHLLNLNVTNHVISTGGSAVYSEAAMNHLKKDGITIFLNVNLPVLQSRIRDYETRGLAKRADQTLEDIYKERFSLYTTYADFIIDSSEMTQEQACDSIVQIIYKNYHCGRTSSGRSNCDAASTAI